MKGGDILYTDTSNTTDGGHGVVVVFVCRLGCVILVVVVPGPTLYIVNLQQ